MHILYLTHDLSDPTTAKRVRMLCTGGATVAVAGFARLQPEAMIAGCAVTDLGRTFNGRFLQRIGAVIRTIIGLKRHRVLFASADIIIARNLEMLAIAARGRRFAPAPSRLIYEVLDIHRLLLREDVVGALLRRLEGWLSRDASHVITSSPAFIRAYFEAQSCVKAPCMLVENKVFCAETTLPATLARPDGPPWRIGWFGAIRCRESLAILCDVARNHPGLVEVIIRGRVSYDQFDDFDGTVASTPGVRFLGAYRNPDELAHIYQEVHFSWAIDMFEAGQNSSWLLPNRMYEGGLFGTVPLTASGVETSRFAAQLGIGHTLMEPKGAHLVTFLQSLTPDAYRSMAQAVARIPRSTWLCSTEECIALVQRLAESPLTSTKE